MGRKGRRQNQVPEYDPQDYFREEHSKQKSRQFSCVTPNCTRNCSIKCINQSCSLHCTYKPETLCQFHFPSRRLKDISRAQQLLSLNNSNNNNNNNNENKQNIKNENVNVNQEEKLDIWFSCREGHLEEVKMWIEEQKQSPNEEDTFHNSPLYYACVGGYTEIVKYLLLKGAFDDPVAKRCKQHCKSPEILAILDCYYSQLTGNVNDEEREKIIMRPIVRILRHLRIHFNPPTKDSIRYQMEQLIPDDWLDTSPPEHIHFTMENLSINNNHSSSNNGSGDDNAVSSNSVLIGDSFDEDEESAAHCAFNTALESYNSLRKSREIPSDLSSSEPISSELNIHSGGGLGNKCDREEDKEVLEDCALKLEEMLDLNICKICFVKLANCVNVPCGHLGFCMGCMKNQQHCPTCRVLLTDKIQVYHV